jgi:4-amino-4-deoxy-L-arabinose transferase-like glycosyltransferase
MLSALLIVGALLRGHWNDVPAYSRADETVYLNFALRVSSEGASAFPKLARDFVDHSQNWKYPPPVRFGYLGAIGLACKLDSPCTHRTLAGVSTLFGILSLVATFLLVRELGDVRTALAATALSVTSPLQLALGRRALSDEMFCAVFLFAFWALVRAIRAGPPNVVRSYALSVALTTLVLSVKETSLLAAPGVLAAIYLLRDRRFERRDLALVALPLVVWYLTFALLSGSASTLFEVFGASYAGTQNAPYVEGYSSGPPHRILSDFFLLSPFTSAVAMIGVAFALFEWKELSPGLRALLVVLVWTLVATSLSPVKNLRYAVNADGLIRALAAWFAVERFLPKFGRSWGVALAAGNALYELWIFHRAFITRGVYDPVTAELARALSMTP